jgi:hypothetical protein
MSFDRRWYGSITAGLLMSVVGCGGKVQGDESTKGEDPSETAQGGSESGDASSPNGGSPQTGTSAPMGSTPLAPCVRGSRPSGDPSTCPWLGDGLCYDTKLAACACVCPRDRMSTCASGFPSDNQSVEVTCF